MQRSSEYFAHQQLIRAINLLEQIAARIWLILSEAGVWLVICCVHLSVNYIGFIRLISLVSA